MHNLPSRCHQLKQNKNMWNVLTEKYDLMRPSTENSQPVHLVCKSSHSSSYKTHLFYMSMLWTWFWKKEKNSLFIACFCCCFGSIFHDKMKLFKKKKKVVHIFIVLVYETVKTICRLTVSVLLTFIFSVKLKPAVVYFFLFLFVN